MRYSGGQVLSRAVSYGYSIDALLHAQKVHRLRAWAFASPSAPVVSI